MYFSKGLNCNHCVLQWRYIAGNNWGICPGGNGAVGCGPQEEFRACSDIAINDNDNNPDSTFEPRATESPKYGQTPKERSEAFNYTKLIISLILVVIFFIAIAVAFLFKAKITCFIKSNVYVRLRKTHPFSYINTASKAVPTLSTTSSIDDKTLNTVEIKSRLTPPKPPPRSKINRQI